MTTKDHISKNFILAYPVVLSQLGHVMVGVVDSLMVGHLGSVPLAGASLGNAIFFFFMTFGLGMSFAITPMVAISDGEGNVFKSVRILQHGAILNTGLSIILFAAIYLMTNNLHLLGQEADVVGATKPYLMIIGLSIFPFLIFQTFRQYSEGLSKTKPPMVISVITNLLNVLLNYIFIFGKLGIPAMGLFGAGLATLISRSIMAVVMVLHVTMGEVFKSCWSQIKINLFDKKIFIELLGLGISSGLQFTFEIGAFAFSAIMMGWIGAKAQAAHQIAINLASISYMAAAGLAAAATIRVGNQLGKRDFITLRKAAMTIYVMVFSFMLLWALLFIGGRFFLPSIYIDDPEVTGIASGLLIIAALFQLSDGAQVVGLGVLRGIKDIRIPMIITFVAYWLVALPMGYILAFKFDMGPDGIWYGLLTGLTIAAALLFYRFHKLTNRLNH